MLTPRQRACLDFIEAFIAEERRGPLYHEIAAGLGLRSRGAAARLVHALMDRGFVARCRAGAGHLALTGKRVEAMPGDLPTVHLSAKMAAEIDALGARHGHPSRAATVDWLLECALYIFTHGSLPPLEPHNMAPFVLRPSTGSGRGPQDEGLGKAGAA